MLPPEAGTVIGGRYRVVKLLGRGGFANAYLADDLREGKRVALKLPELSQLGDPAVYERFRREIAIGRLLHHPDLIVTTDFSEENPPYLVFDYVEGKNLAALLDEKNLPPVEQSVNMVASLLEALDYCHKRGVYHRDIKPENLMVGSDGHLKVLDFGIAMTSRSPRVTWRGFSGLIGTPEYGDGRSDIYAVGCLLYHMIAGNPPYTGDNPMAVMYQHLASKPKPLTEIRPGLHPGVWACVCRAMRRRKDERYRTAREMAEDLRNPDRVDLSYAARPDPPMVSIAQSKHVNRLIWLIAGIAAAAAAVFLVCFLSR